VLTRLSVAQTRPGEDSPEPLSSAFHSRLVALLSDRAIIDSVNVLRRSRALLLVSALAGLVGLSLLVSACGGSPGSRVAQLGSSTTSTQGSPSSTTSAGSAQRTVLASELVFSRCMRSRGVPNFPDPDSQGDFPPFSTGVSKQTSAAANDACKHLLSRAGSTGTPQQRREKLTFALKVAQCLRTHGFPTFPDPNGSRQGNPPGIDLSSPQFQTAETSCEKRVRKALGLP
jgi:hypothetical protein